jgi:aldehyde:ferredoxin oxidoreductase
VEPAFYNAVTGKKITFTDGIETGRKIWNLNRSILVLQGRNRDMEKLSGFVYRPGAAFNTNSGGVPLYDGSRWNWVAGNDMYLDERGVEQWKTAFYLLEGWDTKTGYPTRKTLEGVGLKHVADLLQAKNKLG